MSLVSISSLKIGQSDNSETTSINKTSNPRSKEQFSSFGESACGEPLLTQNILLDFTPDDEIDNEIVQKKICAFWKFIKSNPEISHLKVKPERRSYSKQSTTMVSDEEKASNPIYNEDNIVHMDRTAVSMLEVVDEKGLITRTFEAKMPQSRCTFDSREYKENEPNMQRRKRRAPIVCNCTTICDPCPVHSRPVSKPMSKAQLLCNTLTEWDTQHPKSMEPPGHPPLLHHCTIKRQVFP